MRVNLNKKGIVFLGFIILFFVLISATSAASTEIGTDTAGGIKSVINNDSYDTIYLKEGIYKGSDNTNVSVSRTKNITIIGKNNKVIIDGEGKNWLFQFGSDHPNYGNYHVKFVNITFQNGYGEQGSAIRHYTEGNYDLTIEKCKFINNAASNITQSNGYGGAIFYSSYGNLSILNSEFTKNKVSGFGANGGAIYTTGGFLTVKNSIFNENEANGYWNAQGGAIFSYSNSTITYSNFTKNKAKQLDSVYGSSGGAIYSLYRSSKISGNIFIENDAYYGSAISVIGRQNMHMRSNINYNVFYKNSELGAIISYEFRNIASRAATHDDPSLIHYVNTDYNWWGRNALPENATNFQNNFTTNNYYMTILNTSQINPAYINSMINYSYFMVLNTSREAYNVDQLPYFTTNITDINGNSHIIDARFQKDFTVKALKLGDVGASSLTHSQLNTISFLIIKIPTSIKTEDVNGKVGQTVKLTAKLVDKYNKPLAGKIVIFTIEGTTKTATTDENGIATVDYYCEKEGKVNFTVNFLGDELYEPSEDNAIITVTEYLVDIFEPNPIYPIPNNTNNTSNNPIDNPAVGKAAMKETGIPIIAVILVLLSSLGLISRKK